MASIRLSVPAERAQVDDFYKKVEVRTITEPLLSYLVTNAHALQRSLGEGPEDRTGVETGFSLKQRWPEEPATYGMAFGRKCPLSLPIREHLSRYGALAELSLPYTGLSKPHMTAESILAELGTFHQSIQTHYRRRSCFMGYRRSLVNHQTSILPLSPQIMLQTPIS